MSNIASSSPSSSISTPKWIYDVFLSFRGEDVRKTFVDFLYCALEQKGIYTFKDDEKLEKGRFISPALCQAIKQSRIAVIIFSENYASSSWCLDELAEFIDCKRLLGQALLPVFYYVDPSVVRKQEGSFSKALAKHDEKIEDKERIQSWRKALAEVASISGWDVPKTANGHESKCIQQIVEDITAKLGKVVTVDEKDKVGIDSRVQKVNALLNLGSDDVRFIGIWGMSGIGKTTIARAVFDRISTDFEGAVFLHEVREHSKYGLEKVQEKILSEILSMKYLRISNRFEGSEMIKSRLRYRKVLIVLDDIDHVDQLEALAGKHEWFGAGSRIIMTTKNKHLIVNHRVNYRMYNVELLNNNEAIQLFSLHAFKDNYPAKDYEDLSIQIVHYAGCLPLALKVLGSFLYGRGMAEWRSEVERLKRIPDDEIMEKLKVSLKGLKEVEKNIFLDIACFFKWKKKDYLTRVLDSFNFFPDIGIKVLMEKSLITVSRGRILMHPLIQEMGWHMVREKGSGEPGKQSRLWVEEDICHVLAEDKVTENVEGLWLDLSIPRDLVIKNEAFEKMHKLRLLKIHNACVSKGPNYITNEIRWLNWHGFPSKSLPASFQAEKLVGLKLQYSRIIELWKDIKWLDKLKFINLSSSQKLVRTPDFRGIPNLERLILEDCSSLIEIHPSAGNLKRLKLFNLKNCTNLRSLPKQIFLESLEEMILSGCSKVSEFPEILGTMNCLTAMYLEATAIKELPPSIEHLTNLVLLNLSYCRNLTGLPNDICTLKCLKALILSGCSKLNKLPEDIGHVQSLEELYGDETAISQPPSSLVHLKNLKTLSFRGCKGMTSCTWSGLLSSWVLGETIKAPKAIVFPSVSGLNSLAKLDLSDCNLLDGGFPCDLGSLPSLIELNLGRNNFSSISAASIENLCHLRILELVGCKRLEILPELPPSIEELYTDNCTSLRSETHLLTKYGKLYRVSFTNCFQLLQDQKTSSMRGATRKPLSVKELPDVDDIPDEDDNFSISLPGRNIPAWFTYQKLGPSITVNLPSNWYNNEFMGFAVCVVFDLMTNSLEFKNHYRQKIPGIGIQFSLIYQETNFCDYTTTIGDMGNENKIDSGRTCLAYVSFDKFPLFFLWAARRQNQWNRIEVSADACSKKYMVVKAWGISLVYEKDVKQNAELLMNQQRIVVWCRHPHRSGLVPRPAPAPAALNLSGLVPSPSPAPAALNLSGLVPRPAPAPEALNLSGLVLRPEPAPAPAALNLSGLVPRTPPVPAALKLSGLVSRPAPAPAPAPVPAALNLSGLVPRPPPPPAPAPAALNLSGLVSRLPPTPAPAPAPAPAALNLSGLVPRPPPTPAALNLCTTCRLVSDELV